MVRFPHRFNHRAPRTFLSRRDVLSTHSVAVVQHAMLLRNTAAVLLRDHMMALVCWRSLCDTNTVLFCMRRAVPCT